jgi:hypothetical protein
MAASTYDAVAGWLTQEQLEAIEGGDHGRCLQYRTPRFASGPTRRVVAAFIQDCEVWPVDGVPNVEGVLLAGEEAE